MKLLKSKKLHTDEQNKSDLFLHISQKWIPFLLAFLRPQTRFSARNVLSWLIS